MAEQRQRAEERAHRTAAEGLEKLQTASAQAWGVRRELVWRRRERRRLLRVTVLHLHVYTAKSNTISGTRHGCKACERSSSS
eukprot:2237346-Rhodomonas_salina.1